MATTINETIMEEKDELMVNPGIPNHHNPTRKFAPFLKPSSTSTTTSLFPNSKISSNVSFNGFRIPQKDWKSWVDRMHSLHKSTWIKAGIHNAVLNSSYKIIKHQHLIVHFAQKWCHETKTFVFKWGEVTITLEDMMVLGGYSVLGESVGSLRIENDELKTVLETLHEARRELCRCKSRKAEQYRWMKEFKDSGSEVEHEAFLVLWLSRFVFPSSYDLVVRNVFAIAVCLARGVKLALAPAVLSTIYRDLSLLKCSDRNDETSVTVWAPFQLVQIWIWERFLKLRPNLGSNCNPRFSKWEKKKVCEKNIDSLIDCGLEDFTWHPYGMNARDDLGFRNLYQDNGRWVVVGDCLDEELESWARCLRVSELVGIDGDCIQQYLPHRVAMQFGMNQDIPGDVTRPSDLTPETAWEFYTRPVKDVKMYFPSRFSEPYVTARYANWWNKSNVVCNMQSLLGDNEPEKLVKDDPRTNGSDEYVGGFGSDGVNVLGSELEDRIKKLEEVFAYLKAKKMFT